MESTIQFLIRHGHTVLIAWVFAEQIGLPVPSIPILLAAGALVGSGHMSLASALAGCLIAAVAADVIWFQLGRLRGIQVLQWICKMSLEPDSCVRRTQGVFSRRGESTLLFAKFVPGINTVAPPLAGVVQMSLSRFLLFDALGTLLWAGTFIGLGYAFTGEIERLAARAESTGSVALALLVGLLVLYLLYKIIARERFLWELRTARITVEDLKASLDAGKTPVIIDLRHALDVEADPQTIPGAVRVDVEELQRKNDWLPHDREIILFCT